MTSLDPPLSYAWYINNQVAGQNKGAIVLTGASQAQVLYERHNNRLFAVFYNPASESVAFEVKMVATNTQGQQLTLSKNVSVASGCTSCSYNGPDDNINLASIKGRYIKDWALSRYRIRQRPG